MQVIRSFHRIFGAVFYLAAVSYAVMSLTGHDVLGSLLHGGMVMDIVSVLVLIAAVLRMDDFLDTLRDPS